MKLKLFFLFMGIAFLGWTQKKVDVFAKVDSLIKIQQPNAAQEELWQILTISQKNKDAVTVSKAYTYFGKIVYPLDAEEKAELFMQLLKTSDQLFEPAKSITQVVMLRELIGFYNWFGYNGEQVRMYDSLNLGDLQVRHDFVLERLKNLEKRTINFTTVDIHPYIDIFGIDKDNNYTYRTLSDYLNYQLVEIYQTSLITNQGVLKNASKDEDGWYANQDVFSTLNFERNLTGNILKLYQQIEKNNRYHPEFLSTAVYHRLHYVMNTFMNSMNDERAEKIWQEEFTYFEKSEARSKFLFEVAKIKYNLGKQYHFKTNPKNEVLIKEAFDLLTQEINLYPNNDFKYEIETSLEVIKNKEISIQIPDITTPEKAIPLFISHRNYSTQYIRIYRMDNFNPLDEKSLKDYFKGNHMTLVSSQKIDLLNKGLFQTRSTELLLNKISTVGMYYVILSEDETDLKQLSKDDRAWRDYQMMSSKLNVTNISATVSKNDGVITTLVVDQKTGKPVKGATVEIYEYVYRWNERYKLVTKGTTDAKGLYCHQGGNNSSFFVIVKSVNSQLGTSMYAYNYNTVKTANTKLITDRTIYRPGQTIYFKGITYSGKDNDFQVEKGLSIKLTVKDASYQEIYTNTYLTNEFGSFDGSFQLPKTTSLGNFQITATYSYDNRSNSAYTSVRVEEYKRPTFELKLNQPEQTARLNDTISFKGNTKAFAGYPISGAKVTYSIYRNWSNYWRYFYPSYRGGDLLQEDTLYTDGNGEFEISFFSATDPNALRYAYYYYEIRVKVTDITGETHEETLTMTLNEIGLALDMNVPSRWLNTEEGKVSLNVVNLAGKTQSEYKGTLEVYKKIEPAKFMNRIWSNAEDCRISEKEFGELYPYNRWDDYADNSGELQLVKTLNFKSGDTLELKTLLAEMEGEFVFKAKVKTKEEYELTAEATTYAIYVDSKKMPYKNSLSLFTTASTVKVGNSVTFMVGSSFKGAEALVTLHRKGKILSQEWVKLDERYKTTYKVTEEDRGGINLDVILFYNGVFYFVDEGVYVPYDNKELTIQTKVFRDKLQPGSKEQWTFTVKDKDGNAVDAELAAAMYDASLDQLYSSNNWGLWPYYSYSIAKNWSSQLSVSYPYKNLYGMNWGGYSGILSPDYWKRNYDIQAYRVLNGYNYYGDYTKRNGGITTVVREDMAAIPLMAKLESITEENEYKNLEDQDKSQDTLEIPQEQSTGSEQKTQLRTNFNETAFFYPTIYKDASNDYVLNFTLPESLTKWKLLLLSHTKTMQTGSFQKEIVAQKDLMITANATRFLRRGDKIDFASKVVNLTDQEQVVTVTLSLRNPITEKELNWFTDDDFKRILTVPANSSKDVKWSLSIGEDDLMEYTLTASNENFSDGERNLIPILSNRVLVTETEHAIIRDKGKTQVQFDAFVNQNSSTLDNKSFTINYTDNLAWNAILALPSLNKREDQSVISLMNSYYANAISRYIIEQNPKIQTIFNQWKNKTPDVFWSELEKNEEVKNILLKETPWVLDAQDETEQRRRIGVLFELNQVIDNQRNLLAELRKMQNPDGGFSWFKEGRSSEYITQIIVLRIAELKLIGVSTTEVDAIATSAQRYVENKQIEAYNKWKSLKKNKDAEYGLNVYDVNWLYIRSLMGLKMTSRVEELITYYQSKLKKDWTKFSIYTQATAGIYFKREGFDKEANLILSSLTDRAKKKSNIGMYWVENSGYYWFDNKISIQAAIIQFMKEVNASEEIIDDARFWLILNKETNAWQTGAETADAIAAILLTNKDYLKTAPAPKINVGHKELVYQDKTGDNQIQVEYTEGLGQVKHAWTGGDVTKDLGNVTIEKQSEGPAALSLFWQYTEDLSKVKSSQNSSMYITKTYKRIVPGDKKEEGVEATQFSIGDKIQIELVVTVDRDLEYVYIKDLRPAGFEPAETTSGYHWDYRVVYYQSPKDASMDLFVERMEKGTYKFTYTVYATHSGEFNSGLASVQCLYAPAFAGNSGTEEIVIK